MQAEDGIDTGGELRIRMAAFAGAVLFMGIVMGGAMWMDDVVGADARAHAVADAPAPQ